MRVGLGIGGGNSSLVWDAIVRATVVDVHATSKGVSVLREDGIRQHLSVQEYVSAAAKAPVYAMEQSMGLRRS